MDRLREKFYQKINDTDLSVIREAMNEIDWTNRMIGLTGGRGCGKTTLILQYIRQNFVMDETVLYLSLDDIYFASYNLADLVAGFVRNGGTHLFLDEVHRYWNWGIEIKNIYDDYPGLNIVFTGSSILDLYKARADLSRRAVMYELSGLSFREFILFDQSVRFTRFALQDILKEHVAICFEINKLIKPIKLFNDYLRIGYYPYFMENRQAYLQKLAGTIDVVLESDIPGIMNIPVSGIKKMRQLLSVISEGVPFQPNIQKLSEKTGITRNTIIHYLHLLEEARIIMQLHAATKGISRMQKPDKLYLYHPNHMFALTTSNTEKGNLRETFFLNQVSQKYHATYPSSADFLIDEQWLFEIGGRSKGKTQLKEHPNGYIAVDDTEYGSGNKIPLWLFGFLA